MKQTILSLTILLGCSLAQAQLTRPLAAYQDYSPLEKYAGYDAVIIEDIGSITFEQDPKGGLDYHFDRKTQYRINSKAGIEWSEIEIPLYRESHQGEYLLEASASVINPGETRKQYPRESLDIYKEKYGTYGVYEKFAVPGVKEGALVEVHYKYASPYLFTLDDWVFQKTIPVLHSQIRIAVTPFYEYALLKRGPHNYTSINKRILPGERNFHGVEYQEMLYEFSIRNLPAFEDESFITNRRDYVDRLEFQLDKSTNLQGVSVDIMTSWPEVNKELLKNAKFGSYISAARKQAKGSLKLLGELQVDLEVQVDVICALTKSTIGWNGTNAKFASDKVKKILEVKEGNAADINLYLVGALRAAGIEAYPVVLSTRSHGKIYRDSPLHRSFNYVIAAVPYEGGYLLRDASDKNYPNNSLPIPCLNGQGLLVQEDTEEWIDLGTGMTGSEIAYSVRLDPRLDEQRLQSRVSIHSMGYDAIGMKKLILDDEEKLADWLDNELLSEFDSVSIRSDLERSDSMTVWLSANAPLSSPAGFLVLHPFAGLPEQECPLTKSSRSYPVDMIYSRKRCYHSEITIPEGYRVSYIPKAFSFSNQLLELNYLPELGEDGVLRIEASMDFKKRMYQPADYKKLRYFYEDMLKRLNEEISLEKSAEARP
jgi:hypothetical protein